MLPMDEAPITKVDEPFALLGFNVSPSALCPSLAISLLVVVELLDSDSFRGGCSVCNWEHRVATGRESRWYGP